MRGLLLKDFYMTWKYLKMIFLIDIVFIVMSFVSDDNLLFALMPIMLSGVTPITLLAYDERSHWTEYCGALPYSGAQIVSTKFLVGLIMQTVTSLIVFITLLIREGFYWADDLVAILVTVSIIFIITLVFPAVCIPFSMTFGTEKGRLAYYAIIILCAGVSTIAIGRTDDVPYMLANKAEKLPVFLIGLAVFYVFSWLLSICIYKRKEAGKV
ncbi:MAG: ABC-2 transporter permease [Ruminococcaceae bacterium]|nr:ABC-2 transporter permease [Oscillospiraceae bacterium]